MRYLSCEDLTALSRQHGYLSTLGTLLYAPIAKEARFLPSAFLSLSLSSSPFESTGNILLRELSRTVFVTLLDHNHYYYQVTPFLDDHLRDSGVVGSSTGPEIPTVSIFLS